jgi:hypothetical protein
MMSVFDSASHILPPSRCPNCGKVLDAATGVDEKGLHQRLPAAGDFTVCIGCGHIMVFANDLTLRNPTAAEMREIAGNRHIIAIQRARARAASEKNDD